MHEVGTWSVEGSCLGMPIVRDGGGYARSECADRTSGGCTSHVGVDQNDDGGGAASLISEHLIEASSPITSRFI
jgi:hypothetical protein